MYTKNDVDVIKVMPHDVYLDFVIDVLNSALQYKVIKQDTEKKIIISENFFTIPELETGMLVTNISLRTKNSRYDSYTIRTSLYKRGNPATLNEVKLSLKDAKDSGHFQKLNYICDRLGDEEEIASGDRR